MITDETERHRFDIKEAKPFDLYRTENNLTFEFRYIASKEFGTVFGLLNGREVYLFVNDPFACFKGLPHIDKAYLIKRKNEYN